jgi:beta-lactamase superfamily II metal-dependent hydrolase
MIERIQDKQIPMRWLSAGDTAGPFEVLHPPANWKTGRSARNDDSLVLLLKSGNRTALLTGDIETRIAVPAEVDVLKVPHHGSRGVRMSSRATIRVISVGANNPFGHPHPSIPPAFRTDRMGAISVVLHEKTPPEASALTSICPSCKLTFLLGGH